MLKFETASGADVSGLFSRVCDHELTGFVLRDALGADTIAMLKHTIEANKQEFYTDLNNGNGFSIPGMFGQLHKTQPVENVDKYFADIPGFCAATDRSSALDVCTILDSILNNVLSPAHAEVLPGFLPYSFRVVYPDRGGLDIHKDGDLLPYIHDNISRQIQQYIVPGTLMSWFFSLQSPDTGGELWVADSDYSQCEKQGQYDLVDAQGAVIRESEISHIRVATPTGSLLVFRGGSYWHKVLPPQHGHEVRITFGGFFAQARDGDRYYYWS